MKLNCDNCGVIECVLVDGYLFGDRLLEGVMFKIEDKDGKPNAIGVTDECEEYFEDFNTAKWLIACQSFCKDLDIAQCPKCGNDVEVWGNSIKPKQSGFAVIKKYSLEDILEERRR